MAAYGYVTYPGVETVLNFEFTDTSGISPARAMLDIMPQDEIPKADGDLDLYYSDDSPQWSGSWHIKIANCRIDAANYIRDSGGKVVRLVIMDERWQWAFGEISGRYNFKQVKCYDAAFAANAAVNFVDPKHEKTPQDLAKLLIEAMGYADSDWDYSVLPLEPRPQIEWDCANPAQELAKMADQFGCRIVPVRSKGKWAIAKTGEGADLPENYPYADPGEGIDPVESPNYLKIVTAPVLFECRLPLEPVAKDTDTLFYALLEVSYCPNVQTKANPQGIASFAYSDPESFDDVSNIRALSLDKQTLISPRELAQQTVYKTYKIQGASAGLDGQKTSYMIPGLLNEIDIQQIILTENRVEAQVSEGSTTVMPLRAFVEGVFWDDRKYADVGNYPLGTRLDLGLLSDKYLDDDDVSIGFSISNADDIRYALISFNSPVTSYGVVSAMLDDTEDTMETFMLPPQLYIHTAIKIREPDTWQLTRDERYRYIGEGPEPNGGPDADGVLTRTIIKNDIQPWFRGVYDVNGNQIDILDNQDLVTKQADAYLDDLEVIYEVKTNARRRYIGLYPIDMDGAIQQVSYKIGQQGQETIASLNTEHDFELPTYEDRRAREARKSPENREAVTYQIVDELRAQGILS